MEKAFGYLRVSGRGQVDGEGFPRQERAIREYARRHKIELAGLFRERGVSGTKDMADRPAFVEMMTALHSDGVRLVLVEKLDRLARDLMVQESILEDFKRGGFSLLSVTEPDLCIDDPTRKLMRQMLGAFAEYEKSMIVLKLRTARQMVKAREGRCEGRKPFGLTDVEREVVERIAQMKSQKMSIRAIAQSLTDEGVPCRKASKWHPTQVRRILNQEDFSLIQTHARV
jgi:DNA invertase Pin-like site-specific DNA recombinase